MDTDQAKADGVVGTERDGPDSGGNSGIRKTVWGGCRSHFRAKMESLQTWHLVANGKREGKDQ